MAALGRLDALPGPATVINLGTGTGTTVRELLDAFNRDGRRRSGRVMPQRPRVIRRRLHPRGAAERPLAWRPRYSLTEGIQHSLQWAAIRDEVLPSALG